MTLFFWILNDPIECIYVEIGNPTSKTAIRYTSDLAAAESVAYSQNRRPHRDDICGSIQCLTKKKWIVPSRVEVDSEVEVAQQFV